jgi:hypothetical protein
MPHVRDVLYVSRRQALELARVQLRDFESVFMDLETNPFPASWKSRSYTRAADRRRRPRRRRSPRGVPVRGGRAYGQDWLDKVYLLRRVAAAASLVVGGAFAAVAALIIGAAIRLAIFARRDEIPSCGWWAPRTGSSAGRSSWKGSWRGLGASRPPGHVRGVPAPDRLRGRPGLDARPPGSWRACCWAPSSAWRQRRGRAPPPPGAMSPPAPRGGAGDRRPGLLAAAAGLVSPVAAGPAGHGAAADPGQPGPARGDPRRACAAPARHAATLAGPGPGHLHRAGQHRAQAAPRPRRCASWTTRPPRWRPASRRSPAS